MSTWDDRTLLEDLLANGVDDWVYESLVAGNIARRRASDPHERRAIALGLIADAIFNGLMVPGTVDDGGFVAWEATPAESFGRIAEAWLEAPDPDVSPGQIVWLNVTERGEEIGQQVLAREASA